MKAVVRVTVEKNNSICEVWRSDAALDAKVSCVQEHVDAWLLLECLHELAKLTGNDDLQRVADAGRRELQRTREY